MFLLFEKNTATVFSTGKTVGLGHSQSDQPLAWGAAYFASALRLYNRLVLLGYRLIQD
jgi:hypothetical protein